MYIKNSFQQIREGDGKMERWNDLLSGAEMIKVW